MTHFNEIELRRWSDSGPGDDRPRIVAHVAECAACATRYAVVIRNRPLRAEPAADVDDFARAGQRAGDRPAWIRPLLIAAAAVIVLLAFAAVLRMNDSPVGAVLRAIRENEDRARAIGFRVRRFKVAAFAISGALAGLAGGLYAELFRFVPLHAIDLETSTDVVIAALLGGTGSPFGALLGAAIFTVLSNSLSHVWSHWPLIFGIVFCGVVLFFRGGLWSIFDRRRTRAAHA